MHDLLINLSNIVTVGHYAAFLNNGGAFTTVIMKSYATDLLAYCLVV